MNKALLGSIAITIVGYAPLVGRGQVLDFDPLSVNSDLYMEANADAYDYNVGSLGMEDLDTVYSFVANFVQPGGTYDWGAEIGVHALDGNLTSSADGFITVDGDATPTLEVRWNASSLNQSKAPINYYYGYSSARIISALLNIDLTGLTPNELHTIYFDWSVEGEADADSEAVYEDSEAATSKASWFLLDGSPHGDNLFDIVLNEDGPWNLPSINANESGRIDFVPTNSTVLLGLSISSLAGSEVRNPGTDDISGAKITSRLRLSFAPVPEPSTLVLLVFGLASLAGCVRRKAARSLPALVGHS